jgi:hypothetical protein
MLTLTTIDGKPALLIPMPKGEPKQYAFTLHVDGEAWSVELSHEDAEYTVWLGPNGQRQCGCAAFSYGKTRPGTCKHLIAVEMLRSILTAVFQQQPEEAVSW